ncbi:DNA translocase FtsK [Desulfobacula toluolica]|uniref:FtsK: predicted DNA translocase n=1 Tax=Desulfobacula toluolica (strain DSM 7467 / Tol2) TaxID=651182 RepID=K0N766_DESTT|nr:DNA translocase FtsK [Desulfobacula toluolica]CCK79809.1 FtsK: predicted DNA translocase [Desulfobacula toluolica Tol2]
MKKELYGIFLFFLIVLTAVSLFSYNVSDPCVGNRFFDIPDHIHNAFGLLGAHLAGFFVFLFGLGAFWIPIVLGLVSVWLLKGKPANIIWLTLLGGLFLIVSTGGLLFLFKDNYELLGTHVSSGGVIGITITSFLLKYANIIGSIIILMFLMILGIIFATGISIISLGLFLNQKIIDLLNVMKTDFYEGINFFNERYVKWQEDRAKAEKQIDITPVRVKKDVLIKIPEKIQQKEFFHEPENVFESDICEPDIFEPTICDPNIVELEEQDSYFKPDADFVDIRDKAEFDLPRISFLDEKKAVEKNIDTDLLKEKSHILERKLKDFNVSGEVVEILPGPVITTFEYRPAPGIKISKIAGLSDDLALALSAISIRIVAPIPGRDVVGIEIPNDEREVVNLRELIASKDFVSSPSILTLGLGKDILGRPMVTKMDSMPHLLIAGATGTGKSVGLNAMIISLLYKGTPDDIKMIMIDPKRIELSVYNDIPHLISPVVTDMKKATNALLWAVREMERRYELLEQTGLRNILQYNSMVASKKKGKLDNSETLDLFEKLPYIVVIVDELADLMMVASKDVEFALTRLAQMARAAGIHLIVATQRPSVDVLTGSIKANFPTRISFQVSSRVDARTIFDGGGSESLLGNGDMLFCPPGAGRLVRIQGAYLSEQEIARVTQFLKDQKAPDYIEDITLGGNDDEKEFDESDYDEKYDEAVALVTKTRQASISFVQRRLRIGYNRAARLVEMMEHEGIVGPQMGSKPRDILVKSYDDD